MEAPAPLERRKRSAAAEAAAAAEEEAGPTGWEPAWPISSEQQFPMAPVSVARRRGEISGLSEGRAGPRGDGESPERSEQVESWRRHGDLDPQRPERSARREKRGLVGPVPRMGHDLRLCLCSSVSPDSGPGCLDGGARFDSCPVLV